MSTVSVCQQRPPSAPPAAPRFENRRCALSYSPGRKKTDSPTHLKVANRSGLVVEGSPARAEAQRSEREKGGDYALGGQGRCPWTPLGGRLKSGTLFSPIPPAARRAAPPRKGIAALTQLDLPL